MESFWNRFLCCCSSEQAFGDSGKLNTKEERNLLRLGLSRGNDGKDVKELSMTTEGLIILLELYKLEMAPLCAPLFHIVSRARSKYEERRGGSLDNSSIASQAHQ